MLMPEQDSMTGNAAPKEQNLFRAQRNLLAASEPEDAAMTGMTRSLGRRLLALNLQPVTLQHLRAAVSTMGRYRKATL